jgi:hypothetical protein
LANPSGDRLADLSKSGIPFVAALMLLSAVGGAMFMVGGAMSRQERELSDVAKIAIEVAALQRTLAEIRPANLWTRTDHLQFCYETERINSGWHCPQIKATRNEPTRYFEATRQ